MVFDPDAIFFREYMIGLYSGVRLETLVMIYLPTSTEDIYLFERRRSMGLYTYVLSIDILAE